METIETPVHCIRQDLFDAIKYEKRRTYPGSITGLEIDGHFVFDWILKTAWEHFVASIPQAKKHKVHTCQQLFNDPNGWDELADYHIAIGRSLSYFEAKKMLPVERFNPYQNNAQYTVF